MRRKFIAIVLLILCCYPLYGSEPMTGSDGVVTVTATISNTDITMAQDAIVEVVYQPQAGVDDAEIATSNEDVVLKVIDEDSGFIKLGIEPLKPGEFDVLLRFEYTGSDGVDSVFGIGEFSMTVSMSLSEEELKALQAGDVSGIIAPIARTEKVESVPYDFRILLAAIAGVVILLVGLIFAAKKRRKNVKEQKKYVVVHNVAYQLLDDLKFMNLPQSGKFKLYYSKLNNVLRYYIEYRFNIQAPDMTTEEFLERIRYSKELGSVDRGGIEKFFEISDMVKFAKLQPTDEQASEALGSVKGFVGDTEDYLCVVEQSVADRFAAILEDSNESV